MNTLQEIQSPNSGETHYLVSANYNKLSDHIRRLTPQGIQCSVFCGGNNCKYENPENWTADSLAIQGIYSHWITDDILAMARPSTIIIVKKNIIQQFESLSIKSIINLQSPKEHASCGQPLEESGFSYDPNIFMENNIYYYNFAWKDYGDASLIGLLNMVKVLAFAVSEGRVAVHCHAGLGRTGVLIACYLVYSLRVNANDAIRYVRLKRPGSVQTRGQILCVRHFAQFILPKTIIYFIKENVLRDRYMSEFSLHKYLKWQKDVLHGYEERHYKFLPKIVHKICERILKLCGCWTDDFPSSSISIINDFFCSKTHENITRHESTYSLSSSASDFLLPNSDNSKCPSRDGSAPASPHPSENEDQTDSYSEASTLEDEEFNDQLLIENKCFQELQTQKSFQKDSYLEQSEILDVDEILKAILTDGNNLNGDIKKEIRDLQNEINTSQLGWSKLNVETNIYILISLLFDWLEGLKIPVITREDFENIVVNYKQAEICFQKLSIEEASLTEYLLLFISKLQPVSEDILHNVLKRFIAALTQQSVLINDNMMPSEKGFHKLRDGTLSCTIEFFHSLFQIINIHHRQKLTKPYLGSTFSEESTKQISDEDSDVENSFH